MIHSRKVAALAVGVVAALSAASLAQHPAANSSGGATLVVRGKVLWLETSQLSALREGVIQDIEFQTGALVNEGQIIGSLHKEMAELNLKKAKLVSENTGEIAEAQAKQQLAQASLARIFRLEQKGKGFVSVDEKEKATAELSVADAQVQHAKENQKVAEAESDIAQRALDEHEIKAPFAGVITKRVKNPGEAVRANEPVVHLARVDKIRFMGYVTLPASFRIRTGDTAEFRPTIENADEPIERKSFPGKVTAIGKEISVMRGAEIQVIAEIENKPDENGHPELELRAGMDGELIVHLSAAPSAPPTQPRVAGQPRRGFSGR
jgi:RND family efflux transporter MFP subunit